MLSLPRETPGMWQEKTVIPEKKTTTSRDSDRDTIARSTLNSMQVPAVTTNLRAESAEKNRQPGGEPQKGHKPVPVNFLWGMPLPDPVAGDSG